MKLQFQKYKFLLTWYYKYTKCAHFRQVVPICSTTKAGICKSKYNPTNKSCSTSEENDQLSGSFKHI